MELVTAYYLRCANDLKLFGQSLLIDSRIDPVGYPSYVAAFKRLVHASVDMIIGTHRRYSHFLA